MAFKNALKMLLSKFRCIWAILLYLLITTVVIVCLSIPFAMPVLRTLRDDGILALITSLFSNSSDGLTFSAWLGKLGDIATGIKDSILGYMPAALSAGAWLVFVLIFAYRFLAGLYEIPLIDVLESSMSSNAKFGYCGRFISRIGKSSCYSLVKIIYTVVADAVIIGIMFALMQLFNIAVLKFVVPFILMTTLFVLLALRYTVISMWAPHAVVRERGIFRSFGYSVKKSFKNFGSIFSTFLVAWILIIAVNMLIGVFTFGAGLIITIPVSVLFINLLNMAIYYNKTGKRYYVDSTTVVTPPVQNQTEE